MRSREVVALDELHHERVTPSASLEAVDVPRCSDDSARRGPAASRWNRASRSGSAANDVGQDLDRDVAIELRVARAIDLAHQQDFSRSLSPVERLVRFGGILQGKFEFRA